MVTKEPPGQINTSSKSRPYRGRDWTWWLVPKPIGLASSLIYIGILVPYLYSFATQSGYNPPVALWQAALMIVTTVALLAMDRVEYFFYREETPTRAAIFLLLTRIVFIQLLSWLNPFQHTPFLHLTVPLLPCL